MKFKVKFRCDYCGEIYYNHIKAKNRKQATKYKKRFKNNNSMIHEIFEGGCRE